MSLAASVQEFLEAATSGRGDRARRLLDAHPEIAAEPWAGLVLGTRPWTGDPNTPGGPLNRAPLLYVAHSCFAPHTHALDLLARGADPNATFTNEYGEMSAIYGAAGVVHDPALTQLLLEAGADPNDGESLYHCTESPDTACLKLLLQHGAQPDGTAALAHAIDYDRVEHVTLLLEAGADPNEEHWALLVHAVRRGCGPAMLRLLAEHGAELDRRGGEWSTPPEEHRTAYQNAVLRGQTEIAALLAELGASPEITDDDLAVAALARGAQPATPLPAKPGPDAQETLILAALHGRLDTIVEALGPDFFGHVGGGPAGTLLHHAAWVGDAAIVGRLLELGADPVARSGAAFDRPIAWAALGSQYHRSPGRDYVAVVQRLLDAGADVEPRLHEVAEGPLADWLAARTT